MPKIDWLSFWEGGREAAGNIYIKKEEMKRMQEETKQMEKEFKLKKTKADAEMQSQALSDAIELHKLEHPAGPTEHIQRIIYGPKGAETGTRKVEVTGMPTGGGAGGKKLGLDDINKTYRKDFIHEEAQKWMANVSTAAQNQNWDTFMKLGQDIQGLETRISQGVAGTSEIVRSQISSATAYWQTIFGNLYPESLKAMGTQRSTKESYPADLPDKVDAAWLKAIGGDKTDLQTLKNTYGADVIDNIMTGLEKGKD